MSAQSETRHFSLAGKRIFVAGHRGMVCSAIMRHLKDIGCEIVEA